MQADSVGKLNFHVPLLAWVGMAAICVAGMAVRGLVISAIWDWFVVPLGARHMPFSSALGLGLFIHFFTEQNYRAKANDLWGQSDSWQELIGSVAISLIFKPIVALFLGAALTAFK